MDAAADHGKRLRVGLIDRLLHQAVVVGIEGASCRLRKHADLIPINAEVKFPSNCISRPSKFRSTRVSVDAKKAWRVCGQSLSAFMLLSLVSAAPVYQVHQRKSSNVAFDVFRDDLRSGLRPRLGSNVRETVTLG